MNWKYLMILACVALLGLLMVAGLFDDAVTETSMLEFAFAFVGLVLFGGGLLGIIAVFARNTPRQISNEELIWWEAKRKKGRTRFIREHVITNTVVFGTLISVMIVLNSDSSGELLVPLIGCLAIWITLAFASYAVAARLWDFFESGFQEKHPVD